MYENKLKDRKKPLEEIKNNLVWLHYMPLILSESDRDSFNKRRKKLMSEGATWRKVTMVGDSGRNEGNKKSWSTNYSHPTLLNFYFWTHPEPRSQFTIFLFLLGFDSFLFLDRFCTAIAWCGNWQVHRSGKNTWVTLYVRKWVQTMKGLIKTSAVN